MTGNRNNRPDPTEQELRIAELKRQVAQTAAGKMMSWESTALPADQREAFWRHVLECETGRSTTDFERLAEAGIEMPEPETMEDEQLTAKLWEVIRALARTRVFLSETDHLSDRELYSLLWHRVLREEVPMDDCGWIAHVGLVSTGGEDDSYLYLKYYADDEWRRNWLAEFPDYELPAHEEPPYCRDRDLPKPPW